MKQKFRFGKLAGILAAAILVCALPGCAKKNAAEVPETAEVPAETVIPSEKQSVPEDDDIVVIFTSDVHGGYQDNLGYETVAALKKYEESKTPYVILCDIGDFSQGDTCSAITRGQSAIRIMNQIGYDYVTLGNHEFDYGMDCLETNIKDLNAAVLGCNLRYTGTKENHTFDHVLPYAVKECGSRKIGFIGVTTPKTLTESKPLQFLEDGRAAYSFRQESPAEFYGCIQENIDRAKAEGADIIILMTHCGDDASYAPFSSRDIIRNTEGVTAVLDGHAHHSIPCQYEKDKNGKEVLLCAQGTKLENIGELLITEKGFSATTNIAKFEEKDEETARVVAEVREDFDEVLKTVVATSDLPLSVTDESGIRMIRNREMPLGDLTADAFRAVNHADIALMNGGGIRTSIPEGEITYEDILSVFPFGNKYTEIGLTGQQIADMLEFSVHHTETEYKDRNGNPVGEFGGFLQLSGVEFDVDTSIPSPVQTDESDSFIGIEGQRRVTNICVQNEAGLFMPIEPEKIYHVAGTEYILLQLGNGYSMLEGAEVFVSDGGVDYQVFLDYIVNTCGGKLSAYQKTADRIRIR